jgi:hypothetical protein
MFECPVIGWCLRPPRKSYSGITVRMPVSYGTLRSSSSRGGILDGAARRDTWTSASSLPRLVLSTCGCEPEARWCSNRRCGISPKLWRTSSRAHTANLRGGKPGVTKDFGSSPSSLSRCVGSAGRPVKFGSPRSGGYVSDCPAPFPRQRPTESPWTAPDAGTSLSPRSPYPSPLRALVRSSASTGAWPSALRCPPARCSPCPGSAPRGGVGFGAFSAGWHGQGEGRTAGCESSWPWPG